MMEDEDIPAVLPTGSPKEPENGGDNNGRTRGGEPDAVVLQQGLQPTAARSARDSPCGARDGPCGARDGPCGARDGSCGARDGSCGARDDSCGAHVSTEIRVLKAGRDLRACRGEQDWLCHSEQQRRWLWV